jgi:5-(carboxyamino)imidazole ribonucleotide synthase
VQDRIREKAFIASAGVPVAPHAAIMSEDDITGTPDTLYPGILKVARLGYDGKGQARVRNRNEALEAFRGFAGAACVLEAMLPLDYEISVVLARGQDGAMALYPSARNEHRDGILAVSTVDAALEGQGGVDEQAAQAARSIAQALGYVGVMCVEFFVLKDGRLVANEIAPRPHNSGHYTMDACACSQFEQQVRAMAGLPLGDTACLASVVMLNILGLTQRAPCASPIGVPSWRCRAPVCICMARRKPVVGARWGMSMSWARRWPRSGSVPRGWQPRWALHTKDDPS